MTTYAAPVVGKTRTDKAMVNPRAMVLFVLVVMQTLQLPAPGRVA